MLLLQLSLAVGSNQVEVFLYVFKVNYVISKISVLPPKIPQIHPLLYFLKAFRNYIVHPFEVYNSLCFSIFTELCNSLP